MPIPRRTRTPSSRRVRLTALLSTALLVPLAATAIGGTASADPADVCGPDRSTPTLSADYKTAVGAALESGPDVWGEELLSRPEGPTYDNIKDYLTPLMHVRQPATRGPMTATEVYYLPFGVPQGLSGRGSIALHVADGSQIITNQWSHRDLQVFVGDGTERYGECLGALDGPRLGDGYLPVLEVGYTDADGVTYQQESFATYLPGTSQLASYVKITAEASGDDHRAVIRLRDFCGVNCHPVVEGNRLVLGGKTYLYFGPGASFDGTDLSYDLDLSGGEQTVYLVRLNEAAPAPEVRADEAGHTAASARTTAYWDGRLSDGATIDVPEPLVTNAVKGLEVQNLLTTWRYSLGNAYEAFYQPESNDTVETLGHLGFNEVYRSALVDLLPKSKAANRRNWEIGTKLFHAADYYRLTKDRSFIDENEATHVRYLDDLVAQNAADPNHLLARQQYSSDIPLGVYGLHQIGVAQRGVQAIAEVWRDLGKADLANRAADFAASLESSYQDAVKASQVTLPDGSLFTPVMLLDGFQPWDPITAEKLGGYWNLVAHYGFGAKVYAPGSEEARRTLQYNYDHGARLLGLLRARDSGNTNVYEVQQLKFLADNDQADQLVLSLYGKLAHGMTRGTFVSGEAHNVGPILTKWPTCRGKPGCVPPSVTDGWTEDEYYRAMYMPPNSANNTSFLEALRLMLVHTRTDRLDRPTGLNLAYATPRGWLEQGKSIRVADLPTEFGTLAYEITSNIDHHQVTAEVDVPSRDAIDHLSLRVRVPSGKEMAYVLVNGRAWKEFDRDDETVDLSGLTGHVSIKVLYRTAR
ncbi:MAG: hypothetical protein ACRDO1_13645 [Nocardioidaceae bacterium]